MIETDDYIAKLCLAYSAKIDDCNTLLNSLRAKQRANRRNGKSETERLKTLAEIQILNAQKNAYVQAQSDIDSISDYMDFNDKAL